MKQATPFPWRDAADRPEASERPDIAGAIDTFEDVLAEIIASQGERITPEVRRVIVAIAAGVHRNSENQQRLLELFDSHTPLREDLEIFAREIAAVIDADPNPDLQAKVADFVFGFGLGDGKSQTDIAAEEGLGKAAISKRSRNMIRLFGRAPARGMKTEQACASYAARQTGKRARPPREPWAFGGLITNVFAPAHAN